MALQLEKTEGRGRVDSTIIQLKDASVSYRGDIDVLRGVNVQVKAGTVSAIIGPNGAGKSTALRTIMGMLPLRTGEIIVEGRPMTKSSTFQIVQSGVSYVQQSGGLFLDMTVEDNLLMGCWTFRHDKKRIATSIQRVFDTFPVVARKRSEKAGSLSGGERRFLEISRALLPNPKAILLDEPTAMIAPKFAGEIYRLTRQLAGEGVGVLFVDQNVRACVDAADYVYVLELGRNVAEGTTEDFLKDDGLRKVIAGWLTVSGG
ncbi:MAG: ABC transporter ATP-binding protein [Rhizobiaceae bacterium]|nr:ABC transporter ATP-binding protein [Rhizobiaceae bacterium]